MNQLAGILLLARSIAALMLFVIIILAVNAMWGHLQDAQAHFAVVNTEIATMTGNTDNIEGVFTQLSETADSASAILEDVPDFPEIPTNIDFSSVTPDYSGVPPIALGAVQSVFGILEDIDLPIPFADSLNDFETEFNEFTVVLEDALTDISAMGTSMDTTLTELQSGNEDIIAAFNVLNNLPFGLGSYLPLIIVGFVLLSLVTTFVADLQRGLALLSRNND
ncbi:MAG: hypothetical protein AAFQ07_10530 [Chloroflexota bacterium]